MYKHNKKAAGIKKGHNYALSHSDSNLHLHSPKLAPTVTGITTAASTTFSPSLKCFFSTSLYGASFSVCPMLAKSPNKGVFKTNLMMGGNVIDH